MKLNKLNIKNYRSISNESIVFPDSKPVILFGPNNVGKSNVLQAINCLLGEKYASYIDFEESDYFQRNKEDNPCISFRGEFNGNIKEGRDPSDTLCFTTNHTYTGYDGSTMCENTYHYPEGHKMYISNDERNECQFILIDATRDISRQLSYFSKYSILSRFSRKMHSVVVQNVKERLDQHFLNLKTTFESVPEYQQFLFRLHSAFNNSVDGFEHKLDIDLTAYDPNNYFQSLRIIAKEGELVRSFDEFGTGEQQILLMSFIKAYAETFTNTSFILGIEEPEAHLHPLAQKWLAQNINNIAHGSIQVIITTHSPDFLDIENLEGFVKVYKDSDGCTKLVQNTAETLVQSCLTMHANPARTNPETIIAFYKSNTFTDQLKGFFARKLILVEGATELLSLPYYFENFGYNLIKNGVEIINCEGKSQIARNYRLFKSYDYEIYCLFDADSSNPEKIRGNEELGTIFNFNHAEMNTENASFTENEEHKYGYFGHNFEAYLRSHIAEYAHQESQSDEPKPLKAKKIASNNPTFQPEFIENIAVALALSNEENELVSEPTSEVIPEDDIPF